MSPVPVAEIAQVPEHVQQMVQNFQRIHFDFDSDILGQTGRDALLENVQIMQANPQIKIQLQGHADERGTTDYNLALGQKRANAVSQYMEVSGISGSRLTITSYGEEAPRLAESSEQAWSQNRRCEFEPALEVAPMSKEQMRHCRPIDLMEKAGLLNFPQHIE